MPLFSVKTSIILPGVQTTIYAPFLRSDNCPCTPNPPYTAKHLIPIGLQKALNSAWTCLANYLVGIIINAIGPYPYSTGFWSETCLMQGSKYAKVFPEPVYAIPIISLPLITNGKDCAWIGKGLLYALF